MADYSLVINSQFKPFSYQEMLAPVLMATQAHQELENQYGELSAKANIWEEMANEQTDPYAYKMYKAYANDLEEKARQLANEGLNASSRRNMLNMRARYSKEISPIEAAYKRREELAAEQRKMSLANPSMFYQRNASAMSLDDFIKNPSMDYGESYSGELLRQQVGQMAANLKTALVGKGKLKGIGLPYQYEQLLQYGYTPQQIEQAINNPQKGNPVLNTMVEQALQASGMDKWASPDQLKRARGYANEGLYNAIGRTEFKNYTDNFSMQEELAKRAEARQAAAQEQAQIDNLAINPLNIYSDRERSAEETKYNNNIKKFSKYFYKDEQGRMRMTTEGLKEYRKLTYNPGTMGYAGNPDYYKPIPSEFKKFIDSIGGSISMDPKAGWNSGRIGNLWDKYISNNPAAKTAKYDATKVTEFDYTISDSQQNAMKDAIMTAGRGTTLKEVDYNPKTKQFRNTGESIPITDLKNDKYKVTATRFSPYPVTDSRGNLISYATVMVQDDKGNVRRFALPAGINTRNESNRDKRLAAILRNQNIVATGKYTDSEGNIRNASPAEIALAQQDYTTDLNQAYSFHSQLGVQNKTKEQEHKPYGY